MLTMFKEFKGHTVTASDGVCGKVEDIYFDDRTGNIRYLVLAVGHWLRTRHVLLTPSQISVSPRGKLSVDMTREQVQHAPHRDTDPPVSRQQLMRDQYLSPEAGAYSAALSGGTSWASNGDAIERETAQAVRYENAGSVAYKDVTPFDMLLSHRRREQSQAHLRSVREITTYEVELECGRVGRMADAWVDLNKWQITHLSLQLQATNQRVAIPATLVRGISWGTGTVRLNASWGHSSDGPCLVPADSPRLPQNLQHNWGKLTPLSAS